MTGMLVVSDRKHDVLKRIQQQRVELITEVHLLMRALNPILRLRRGIVSIVDHPLLWLVSAGIIVFSIGPNRLVRTFLSAWNIWQIARFFKKRGIWSH